MDLRGKELAKRFFRSTGIRAAPDGDLKAALPAVAFSCKGGDEAGGDGVVFANVSLSFTAADIFGQAVIDIDVLCAIEEVVGID